MESSNRFCALQFLDSDLGDSSLISDEWARSSRPRSAQRTPVGMNSMRILREATNLRNELL
ncbi:hypothetical protein U1Q18_032719, partial [Sarracenia purpurea var. burkii]